MLLKTIKATKSPEKVNLVFSGGFYLPLAVEDVYTLGLSRHQEVDDTLFSRIIHRSLYYLVYNYALRQIAMSPKNDTVLKRKISAYLPRIIYKYQLTDFSINKENLIEDVMAKITASNLTNDRDFVSSYIRRHPRKSLRQLRYELQNQGVSPELLSELLHSQPRSDLEKIRLFLAKKSVTKQDLADPKYKNKILYALARRGFNYDDIITAIDDLGK